MLNATDERRITEHLINNRETELMPHELNEMLEQELSKPEAEVDAGLVRDILELLEIEKPSPEEKAKCWKTVQRKMKRGNRYRPLLRLVCVSAAVLIVVFFVSLGTASALNWTFLLKHFSPIAETFGLYSMSNVDHEAAENQDSYTHERSIYKQLNYGSLAEMPPQLREQNIIPDWIPARFQFVSGTIYEDENMASASLYFCSDENARLTLILSFYEKDEDITSYVYEVSTDNQSSLAVGGHTLTYYFNDDGEIRAVSAIEENAHFYIGGNISEEELGQIVASMND